MNILVIKQTSLGDVLHSTGHIRAIKENFPHCRLTLLTAAASADIYRHNPRVDDLIVLELARVKREWRRHPLRTARHLKGVIGQLRATHFELAFDLQGLARSVVFLYAARARKKYVKGKWPGLRQFRNPALHAINEMDGVLARARLTPADTAMEIFTDADARRHIEALIEKINPQPKPLLIFSPFSRWQSKDWPLPRYVEIAARLGDEYAIAFTGATNARARIDQALSENAAATSMPTTNAGAINLAGDLSIPQFAELVRHADLMLTGDSFPMHLACAQKTPVVALFAPTDETRTGPVGASHKVIRAPDCPRCDRAKCQRGCMERLSVDAVFDILMQRKNLTKHI